MDARQDIAAARSRSYWFLSRLFLEQPEVELIEELVKVLDAAGEDERGGPAASLHAAARAALASAQVLTDLQVEYTRLLGGASKMSGAPEPYESVAREGRLFGASAEAVSAEYVDAGHQDLVSVTGPPDHVGTELRFLALLCYQEMQAWAARDEPEAMGLLEREMRFLEQHVLAWVPSLCDALGTVTAHRFYVAVVRLTSDACTSDRDEIASLLRAEEIEQS